MSAVFLDTAPLIYLLEGAPERRSAVDRQLKTWVESGEDMSTSVITLLELLVHPHRRKDVILAERYRNLLIGLISGPLVAIDEHVATLGAELRARYDVAAADALQLAAALSRGCAVFYTNDRRLLRVRELSVRVIEPR